MWVVDYVGFGIDTTRTDISYKIFNDYFELPVHAEAEIIVEYKDTVAAIETLRDVIRDNNFPVNYITEVRNDLSLSSCSIMMSILYTRWKFGGFLQ